MIDTVLDAWDLAENKVKSLSLRSFYSKRRRQSGKQEKIFEETMVKLVQN